MAQLDQRQFQWSTVRKRPYQIQFASVTGFNVSFHAQLLVLCHSKRAYLNSCPVWRQFRCILFCCKKCSQLGTDIGIGNSLKLPVLDVIKPSTAVTYGRKLRRQCYKTSLRPYFTPTEPSSSVITHVYSRHWQRRNNTTDVEGFITSSTGHLLPA